MVQLRGLQSRNKLPHSLSHSIRRPWPVKSCPPPPQPAVSCAGEGFPASCSANNSNPMAPLNYEVPWCSLNCRGAQQLRTGLCPRTIPCSSGPDPLPLPDGYARQEIFVGTSGDLRPLPGTHCELCQNTERVHSEPGK